MVDGHIFSFSKRPAMVEYHRQRVQGMPALVENLDADYVAIFHRLVLNRSDCFQAVKGASPRGIVR
jgi:hypothetical protein